MWSTPAWLADSKMNRGIRPHGESGYINTSGSSPLAKTTSPHQTSFGAGVSAMRQRRGKPAATAVTACGCARSCVKARSDSRTHGPRSSSRSERGRRQSSARITTRLKPLGGRYSASKCSGAAEPRMWLGRLFFASSESSSDMAKRLVRWDNATPLCRTWRRDFGLQPWLSGRRSVPPRVEPRRLRCRSGKATGSRSAGGSCRPAGSGTS